MRRLRREVQVVTKATRKKKPARERGYQPIEEVAGCLRALAAQLVQDNKGRLAKVTLNIWYEDDDMVSETESAQTTTNASGA